MSRRMSFRRTSQSVPRDLSSVARGGGGTLEGLGTSIDGEAGGRSMSVARGDTPHAGLDALQRRVDQRKFSRSGAFGGCTHAGTYHVTGMHTAFWSRREVLSDLI